MNGEEFSRNKLLIDKNVSSCNACYIHPESFSPFTAIINPSKILVVTDWPPEQMQSANSYVLTKDYLNLVVYFGDSWLTRPVSPLSHTFAIKCFKSFFHDSVAMPINRCRIHTVDYILGLGFSGIIAVGEDSVKQIRANYYEMKHTKNGRLTLGLKHPSQSSMPEIQLSIDIIKKFQDSLRSLTN